MPAGHDFNPKQAKCKSGICVHKSSLTATPKVPGQVFIRVLCIRRGGTVKLGAIIRMIWLRLLLESLHRKLLQSFVCLTKPRQQSPRQWHQARPLSEHLRGARHEVTDDMKIGNHVHNFSVSCFHDISVYFCENCLTNVTTRFSG